MDSRGIAVLPGPRTSFLDHLIPLCDYLNIPLLCTDEWVALCAETFYPPIEIIRGDYSSFQSHLDPYDKIVTVEPCRLHSQALQFGEFLYRGNATTIAGFHGNPSKFREEYWIERYADEDVVLVYGKYLIDYLQEKGVLSRLKQVVTIGNIRKAYYDKYQNFLNRAILPHLFQARVRKTILWVPTWTFPEPPYLGSVLEVLPDQFQILLKLHPYTHRMHPDFIHQLKEQYADHPHIMILDEIPLIYPLLAQVDFYLGDSSSIAFDFLLYNRPLFIFGEETYPWARTVSSATELFQALSEPDTLAEMRQNTYRYVYAC